MPDGDHAIDHASGHASGHTRGHSRDGARSRASVLNIANSRLMLRRASQDVAETPRQLPQPPQPLLRSLPQSPPQPLLRLLPQSPEPPQPPADLVTRVASHTVMLKRRVDWLETQMGEQLRQMAGLREQVAALQRQVAAQERRT